MKLKIYIFLFILNMQFRVKSFSTASAFDPNEISKSKTVTSSENSQQSWTEVYKLYEYASVSIYNIISKNCVYRSC